MPLEAINYITREWGHILILPSRSDKVQLALNCQDLFKNFTSSIELPKIQEFGLSKHYLIIIHKTKYSSKEHFWLPLHSSLWWFIISTT